MPRNAHDYYTTPAPTIADFITKFRAVEPGFDFVTAHVFDPSAGGCAVHPAAYPTALRGLGCTRIDTLDIRPDSRASVIGDYMQHFPETLYDMVITNPPYASAMGFIEAALEDTKPGGFVVMLLRLNYFGAVSRRAFWQANMPTYCFIHAKRPHFMAGKGDSCEYAHFVWIAGQYPDHAKTYVI
jgi:hypothetical protein